MKLEKWNPHIRNLLTLGILLTAIYTAYIVTRTANAASKTADTALKAYLRDHEIGNLEISISMHEIKSCSTDNSIAEPQVIRFSRKYFGDEKSFEIPRGRKLDDYEFDLYVINAEGLTEEQDISINFVVNHKEKTLPLSVKQIKEMGRPEKCKKIKAIIDCNAEDSKKTIPFKIPFSVFMNLGKVRQSS